MSKSRKVLAALLLITATVCFSFHTSSLLRAQAPPPPPPMGLLGMPPFSFFAAGDSVVLPVEIYPEVPADSQVTGFAMTIRKQSSDLTFLPVDTAKTTLAGWIFAVTTSADSIRVEATAPSGTFYVKPDGPPELLFWVTGLLSAGLADGDSLELKLGDVSLVSQGNVVAFPDSEFVPVKIFIGQPAPPPAGGAELFAIFETMSKPDSNFVLDFGLINSVPADSELSKVHLVVKANPPVLDWNTTGHFLAPEISGWTLTTVAAGDSLTIDLEAPSGSFLVHTDVNPLVLVGLTGKVQASAPPDSVVDVIPIAVALTRHGVENVEDPNIVQPGLVIMDKGGGTGPPPGGGTEIFAFFDAFSMPDSNFVLDFVLAKPFPADSELSRIRLVLRAAPSFIEWNSTGHLLSPDLNGWTISSVAAGDSFMIDLKAPTDSNLVHTDMGPLPLVGLTGKVQAAAPPESVIEIRPTGLYLTKHGVEETADPIIVRPGLLFLKKSGGGGDPPPPPPVPQLATTDGRTNLGLYGGTALDMAFDEVNGIMLAAIATPQSVFMSADSGLTWTPAFSTDSLEFITDGTVRGFGGRGMQVLSSGGYCYARNSQEAGLLTGTQVSTDGVNWRTLMDGYLASKLLKAEFGSAAAPGPFATFALSGHGPVALVGIQNFVFRTADAGVTWDISVLPDASAISSSSDVVTALAVHGDDPSGQGFYATLGGSFDRPGDAFYRTVDGSTFTPIYVASGSDTADTVLGFSSHPLASDTLWAAVLSQANSAMNGTWRSYDAGLTWTQIYISANPFMAPKVKIYQDSNYTGPDNIRLFLVGEQKYSDDLGDTWDDYTPQNDPYVDRVSNANAGIGHIPNTYIYFSQGDGAPARSTTGLNGEFLFVPTGIEGVTIWDIAQVPNDMDKVYLATSVGIAYTSVFTDTTIAGTAKWGTPYGNYPINPSGGGNMGFSAIEIDPHNTSHVVAANGNGIFMTETGGFTNSDWHSVAYGDVSGLDEPTFKGQGGEVSQITFITSDSVIAALNTQHVLYGALILSTDGGQTWATMPQAGNHNFQTVVTAWNTARDSLVLFAGGGAVATDPVTHASAIDTGGVYKSLDWGASWSRVAVTPNGTFNPAPFPLPVNEMMAKPGSLDTLYMACGENLSNAIVRTFDGGHTLESISMMAVGPREGAFEAVAINKHHPDSIYFAIRRDILVYDAVSNSATTLFRGYPGELTHTLLYDELTMGSSSGFYSVESSASGPVSVSDTKSLVPTKIQLAQNYPNPFNPSTNIRFSLPVGAEVKLEIFNILGQRIEQLLAGKREAGEHTVLWKPKSLASGVYFYQLRVTFADGREQTLSKKLMLLK